MYVRITPFRFNLSYIETVLQFTREVLLPVFRQQPGFQGYKGGIDRKQGTGIVLSFWETREQAHALSTVTRPLAAQARAATVELDLPTIVELLVED